MRTPRREPQGSLPAVIAALILLWIRVSPGLFLITLGSGLAVLDRPWWGAAVALLGAFVYSEQCYRTPYTPCRRCTGIGWRPRRLGHYLKACRACRGKGVRMRWGRRAMNAYRRATHTPPTPTGAVPAQAARRPGPVDTRDALRRRLNGH